MLKFGRWRRRSPRGRRRAGQRARHQQAPCVRSRPGRSGSSSPGYQPRRTRDLTGGWIVARAGVLLGGTVNTVESRSRGHGEDRAGWLGRRSPSDQAVADAACRFQLEKVASPSPLDALRASGSPPGLGAERHGDGPVKVVTLWPRCRAPQPAPWDGGPPPSSGLCVNERVRAIPAGLGTAVMLNGVLSWETSPPPTVATSV